MATLIRSKNGRRTINQPTTAEKILALRKALGMNLREADKDYKFRQAMRTPLHLISLPNN